MNTAERCCMVY